MNNIQYSNKTLNIVFFGSSEFSLTVLKELLDSSTIKVCTVVTKSDKKIGRNSSIQQNIIAKFAQGRGLNVVKVTSLLKDPTQLKGIFNKIDYAVVVSFGYILPNEVLDLLPNLFINLHASLLPKYRGASPIQQAVVSGDTVTGNSIMILDDKMDEGPILKNEKITIGFNQTSKDLFSALAKSGSRLLIDTLLQHKSGKIKPTLQDPSKATYTKLITKDEGFVTLTENYVDIYNKYRAYIQWPGLYTNIQSLEKFLGITTKIDNKQLVVKLKKLALIDDNLHIEYLQLPNKPTISLKDFYNGYLIK